jgi:hypothetical protein
MIDLCLKCYNFTDIDETRFDERHYTHCPICDRKREKRDLTEDDIDNYLDISFGCKKYWQLNSLMINGIPHTYFELNDLHDRKNEMKMMLMCLMGKKNGR